MVWQGKQLLILLVIFIQDIYGVTDVCRDAVAPSSQPRGVNRINRSSSTPLIELDVNPVKDERRPDHVTAYKISISVEKDQPFRFSQAVLAVTTNGSCGLGEFDFNPQQFVEVAQDYESDCPRLIQTKHRSHMTELMPLAWIPPSCGCIHFRILILESGQVYYAENEGVTSGPLAKSVCLQNRRRAKISRERRLESLCRVIDKHSSTEIMSRAHFQRYRDLEARWMDRLGLEMALEMRRSDAKTCCHKQHHRHRISCFDDARRRRIDQFCADGVPDLPFMTFRRRHMRNLEKSCCYILGEFRYMCFAKNSELDASAGGTSILDYSMDASDLVNDLAAFGSHEYLDDQLNPRTFQGKQEEYDVDDNVDDDDVDDDNVDDDAEQDEDDVDGFDDDDSEEDEDVEDEDEIEDEAEDGRLTTTAKVTPKEKVPSDIIVPSKTETKTDAFSRSPPLTTVATAKHLRGTSKEMKRKPRQRKSRISSAERKKAKRRENRRKQRKGSSSGERRERLRKPLHRGRLDVMESKQPMTKKDVGHMVRRQPMNVQRENPMSPTGFDKQNGYTERTLNKLQRRMRRLKLQSICCKAGADIGEQTFGGKGQVTAECKHSSVKYVREINLGHGSRKCAKRFAGCCMEEAKKGLTMTSQEFIESRMTKWNNNQRLDPTLMGSVLSQRGRSSRYPTRNPVIVITPRRDQLQPSIGTKNARSKIVDPTPRRPSIVAEVSEKTLHHEHRPIKKYQPTKKPSSESTKKKTQKVEKPSPMQSLHEKSTKIKKSDTLSKPALKERKVLDSKLIKGVTESSDPAVGSNQDDATHKVQDKIALKNITENDAQHDKKAKSNDGRDLSDSGRKVYKLSPVESTVVPLRRKPMEERIVYVEYDKSPVKSIKGSGKYIRDYESDKRFDNTRKAMSKDDFDEGFYRTRTFDDVDDKDDVEKNDDDDDDDDDDDVDDDVDDDDDDDVLEDDSIEAEEEEEDEIENAKTFITTNHHEKSNTFLDKSNTGKKLSEPSPTSLPSVVTETLKIQHKTEKERVVRLREKSQKKRMHKKTHKRRGYQQRYKKMNVFSDSDDKLGNLDSREMAERNKRKFMTMGALDSQEMADQYIRNSDRLYKKNKKQFKYIIHDIPNFGKGHRRRY